MVTNDFNYFVFYCNWKKYQYSIINKSVESVQLKFFNISLPRFYIKRYFITYILTIF